MSPRHGPRSPGATATSLPASTNPVWSITEGRGTRRSRRRQHSDRMFGIRSVDAADANRVHPRAGTIELEADDVDSGAPFGGHAVAIAAVRQRDFLNIFIINIYRD